MDSIIKDVSGIAMAIVGLAILYTLVNSQNDTAGVIRSAGNTFSQALAAAMGAGVSGSGIY